MVHFAKFQNSSNGCSVGLAAYLLLALMNFTFVIPDLAERAIRWGQILKRP